MQFFYHLLLLTDPCGCILCLIKQKPKLVSTFPIEIDACDDELLGNKDDGNDDIDPVDDECDSFTTEMSQVREIRESDTCLDLLHIL